MPSAAMELKVSRAEILLNCGYVQYYLPTMITEEVYFWRIQWAGTWMMTHTRVSEQNIRQEHPEAIRIEDSRLLKLIPETPQERMQVARTSLAGAQGGYRV